MKTAKGHNYSNILGITTTDVTVTVRKGLLQIPFDVTQDYLDKMIPAITERIQVGTKPAATLQKQLERVEHHREQMLDAYTELFRCYDQMVNPHATRTSPIDKARSEMLTSIPDMKMLRAMCTLHIKDAADAYVLPDEKSALIAATVAAMRESNGENGKI